MMAWRDYFAKPGPQTAGMIIKWWEVRRLYYNIVIFLTIALFCLILPVFVKPAGTSEEATYWASVRFHIIFSFLLLQIPANLWYTGGWVADLLIKKGLKWKSPGFGPWAQAIGIAFSLIFTFFMMIAMWAWNGLKWGP